MATYKVETGTRYPNFLASEVGMVLVTAAIPKTLGTADGDRTIVKAGTPYPANTAACTGLVYETVDVTDGEVIASVLVAGRVITDRITIADAAKTALTGITWVDAQETTRPDTEEDS